MNVNMELWKAYYLDINNLEKIANECRYREVVIIRDVEGRKVVLRPIKIFKTEHFQFWIERLKLTETLFDIYISNASVRLPKLPGDMHHLAESRIYLNEHWTELITGMDIFADIDIGEESHREKAKEYALLITMELQKKGYNDTQLWDTTRGFHVIDKGRFKIDFVKDLIMDICCDLQIPMSMPVREKNNKRYVSRNRKWYVMKPDELTPIVDKPNCDNSIYDIRRIRRTPYSLHSKTGKPMKRVKIIDVDIGDK